MKKENDEHSNATTSATQIQFIDIDSQKLYQKSFVQFVLLSKILDSSISGIISFSLITQMSATITNIVTIKYQLPLTCVAHSSIKTHPKTTCML